MLCKYVHFIRDDDEETAMVFKIKLQGEAETIAERLAEVFGFEEGDEIVAMYKGKNVPLSWLTLPHNPYESDVHKLEVTVTKKKAGEDVKYSYPVSKLRKVSRSLKLATSFTNLINVEVRRPESGGREQAQRRRAEKRRRVQQPHPSSLARPEPTNVSLPSQAADPC